MTKRVQNFRELQRIYHLQSILTNLKTLLKSGDIFIALKTSNDGHKYVNDAIKNGASKVVVEYGDYEVETIKVKNTKEYLVSYLHKNYSRKIRDLLIHHIPSNHIRFGLQFQNLYYN